MKLYTKRLYMKQALFLSIILAPLAILAQAPAPLPVTIDSQRGTAPALSVFQANEMAFRVSYKSGGTANNIQTETPFMYWQPYGATNATVVTGTYSIVNASSGIVDFAFSPADLNFAPGVYTYQAGLDQSGGPTVIKQGAFTILASAASVGADPVIFATTNINWGSINWTGLPSWDYITNVNAKLTTLSNNLQSAIDSVDGGTTWSGSPATQDVNFAQYYATNIGGIDFDTTPSGSPQPARIQWNSSRSTLDLGINENINLDVGQQLMLFAKSIETNTINKGEVVFVAGASGDNPTIKRASNETEPLSARTIGIAAETIASNNNGIVVIAGTVYNINTTNFTQGANLYLGANGTLQTNLPTAPLHGVFIGVVERVGENNGQIFVHVQNYQEIEELSDVNVRNRQADDLLLWNGTVWTNYPKSSLTVSEVDPVWTAASTGYYTIVAADAKFATGSPIYSVAGLATGTPLYAFTEVDPIWSSASNLYYPASNPSNFLTSYTETDPVWTAASNLYATTAGVAATYLPLAGGTMSGNLNMGDNAITNVPILSYYGRTVELETGLIDGSGWYFQQQPTIPGYLTSTGAAALYVTGDVIRVEADPIWTSASSLYYTITAADAKFATGTPIYSISGKLDSNTWAAADSTTNYASRITFNATSNAFNTRITAVEGYTNRAASALASSVWASAASTTNYLPKTGGTMTGNLTLDVAELRVQGTGSDGIRLAAQGSSSANSKPIKFVTTSSISAETTSQIFSRPSDNRVIYNSLGSDNVIAYLSEVAAATSTLAPRVALLEPYTSRVVAVEAYTNRAALALASNVWAAADSTTNYTSRITFNSATNYLNNKFTNYFTITAAASVVTTNNLSTIAGSGLAVSNNQLVVTNVGNIGIADIDVNTFSITNIGNLYGFNSYGNIVFPEDDIPFLSGQWNMGTNINYTGTSGDFVVGNGQVTTSPSLVISNENGAVFMNLSDTTFTITTSNTNLDNFISFNSEEVLTTGDFSPTAYLKISAANTNYWKISTPPSLNTSPGTYGQAAISGTNMYFYNHLSNKWLKVNGTLEW